MSTTSNPWVLGLSASHNGAACLLHDEVFDHIRRKLGPKPDSFLIRLFAQHRRWRLISFRETPIAATPPA